MKAQIITTFGDPSVFSAAELPTPTLQPGHVLIKVHASSVNPIDCKMRSGMVPAVTPELPAVLHGDVAGVVEAIGDGVSAFKVGDAVYGYAGGVRGTPGALAEYMLADAQLLAKKPASLSMLVAAALPLVSITAWEALFTKASLKKDQTVLIHGGVGGVGHIAVQLAKWCGAKVYTTVRKPEDYAIVKSFGADDVIDAAEEVASYTQRLTQGNGFDVVFDTVGGANLDKSFLAAKAGGTVVTIVARSSHDLTPLHSKGLSLHAVFALLPILMNKNCAHYGEILKKVAEIVDAKKLTPLIDSHHFDLAHVADAHALLESGKAQGKVVVSVV